MFNEENLMANLNNKEAEETISYQEWKEQQLRRQKIEDKKLYKIIGKITNIRIT